MSEFQSMLLKKLDATDFNLAIQDVLPFIYSDQKRTDTRHWNAEFFKAMTRTLMPAQGTG